MLTVILALSVVVAILVVVFLLVLGKNPPTGKGPAYSISEDNREARWIAIYGTSVTMQVWQQINEGRGPPGPDDMRRIIGESCAIADNENELAEKFERE